MACAVAARVCSSVLSATALQILGRLPLGTDRLLARIGVADREGEGLQPADLRREVLVARGLARLSLQAVDLRLDLAQHVFDADKIVLGRLQPQLSLVAAGMQAGDAGRLFQDAPARLGAWPR